MVALIWMVQPDARLFAEDPLRAELSASSYSLLFESYDSDNWDLFVVRPDGTQRRNLTRTPEIHELYPQASPDGKRICFLADTLKQGKTVRSVCFMNRDGSDRQTIAEGSRQPCWSPDSKKIAFVKQEYPRFSIKDFASKGLFIYDLESGETTQHPNQKIHHLYGLNWSADGNWIVSTVHAGMGYGHAILAIDLNSDKVVDLKIPGCRPCLSDDGKRITWSSDDHTICAADIDFTNIPKVSGVKVVHQEKKLHLYHPDFSSDGNYICFSSGPGGRMPRNGPGTHIAVAEMVGVRGPWNLMIKRSTGGSEIVQVTNDATLSNKESDWIRWRAGDSE